MGQKEAYAREIALLGEDRFARLRASHVAVFGIGGVGSYAAEALVRAGIGAVTLVDGDVVAESNLNRQLVALHSTLGKKQGGSDGGTRAGYRSRMPRHGVALFLPRGRGAGRSFRLRLHRRLHRFGHG